MSEPNPLDTWLRDGYSLQEARRIVAWLRSEKQRLLKKPRKTSGLAAEKRNVARQAREIIQKKSKRLKRFRPPQLPPYLLTASYKDVPLLADLYPKRKANWQPILRRKALAQVPVVSLKDFSFVHNARGTMAMFSEIVRGEGIYTAARLDFNDHECLDIGPFLLLQAVKRHLAKIYVGGTMQIETQRIIDCVGLRVALQMHLRSGKDHEGIWPFHLRQRRPANTSSSETRFLDPQNREIVAGEFVDSVDDWLKTVATQKLSTTGADWYTRWLARRSTTPSATASSIPMTAIGP